MTILSRWFTRFSLPMSDSKGPWGGSGGGGADDEGSGPRNPWTLPPGGKRAGNPRPSTLDEFLKRARSGGPGGGGGFGGPGFPGGASGGSLIGIGIAILVVAWLVFTSFHAIGPQQRGVATFFGRYSGTLAPGYRLTLPAPFVSVKKVDVRAIRTDTFPQSEDAANLMLTGDQNIIDLGYLVRWNIKDPQNYVFEIAEPQATLRATAESAMRTAVAGVTLNEAIGPGRSTIEARVQDLMQSILDSYHSGISVQGVSIKKADPPAAVIDDFKAVTAAQQDAQANLNQAQTYAQQLIAHAQGEAAEFDKVYGQYRLAPEVTRRRMYYETMEEVLARSNKTIVETPGVTPYLPLPAVRGNRPQAAPSQANPQAQAQPQAQPATGGAQ